MRYFYVRRLTKKDGVLTDFGVVDIPERDLADTLKRNPEWIVESEANVLAPAITTEEKRINFECPICGKEFTSERGLKVHKATHL